MSGAWPATGSAVFCAALCCAAAVAWTLTGRNGPGHARLLLATGTAHPPQPHWRDRVRRVGGLLRARLRARLGKRLGYRHGARTGRRTAGRVRELCARTGRAWWCLPAGALVGLPGDSVIPLVLGSAAVPLVGRWERKRRARAAVERREDAVIELCASVAGELRSGRLPSGALLAAGAGKLGAEGSALLAAARFGGDVPGALHRAARLPGADGLRGAAACWQVSADGGAGLADGLDRVADALRAERDQRDELRSQLAGPRSTATVLALLPAFGLLLGTAMGADPLRVLLHSPAGLGCLVAGGLLEWAGLAWVAHLVRTAEEGT